MLMALKDLLMTYQALWPEMALGVLIAANVLWGCFFTDRVVYYATQCTWVVVWALLLWHPPQLVHHLFHGMFVLDGLAFWLKALLLPLVMLVCAVSAPAIEEGGVAGRHYWVLLAASVLGMMVTISAHHFLILFLGVELMSLPVYAMIAMDRHASSAPEAAIKYLIMGALASGILLYGFALIYGSTQGHMGFIAVAHAVQPDPSLLLSYGMVLLIVAMGFKLGAAPFHMWVPDVYAGAPSFTVLWIATASKLAGFAMVLRLLVEVMPVLVAQWQLLLIIMAIASMVVGNFVAVMQDRIRRLLAYSSIAHMGYMLLGFASGLKVGFAAACFYQFTYVLSALGAFSVVVWLGRADQPIDRIADLRGLSDRSPGMAFVLLILLFSMAGIPPLVGFWAKLAVLQALVDAHLVWLAALALVFAIVGVFYYIRVIKVIYFEKADQPPMHAQGIQAVLSDDQPQLTSPLPTLVANERWVMWCSALGVLGLGLWPSGLWRVCQQILGLS